MIKSLRGLITGGKNNYGINFLTLGRIIKKWSHNMVFSISKAKSRKDEIFLDNFGGCKKEEIRPCLFTMGGILAKKYLDEKFLVTYLKIILPEGRRIFVYNSSDCPFTTEGIGAHLTTDSVIVCQDLLKKTGENKTKWFGEEIL